MAEKLTPEEIIKALECCKPYNDEGCLKCPLANVFLPECAEILSKESVDLINSQQAEIEEWKKINQQLANEMEKRRKEDIGIAKGYARIEAIKEFAKRLRKCMGTDTRYILISEFTLNNLVKEMVGDDK